MGEAHGAQQVLRQLAGAVALQQEGHVHHEGGGGAAHAAHNAARHAAGGNVDIHLKVAMASADEGRQPAQYMSEDDCKAARAEQGGGRRDKCLCHGQDNTYDEIRHECECNYILHEGRGPQDLQELTQPSGHHNPGTAQAVTTCTSSLTGQRTCSRST